MACYHPLSAFRLASGEVVFREVGDVVRSLQLPCGQCVGCRLERSRQWAVRMMHESQLYDMSSFVTLTYSDQHLPFRGSLNYSDFQRFMKRVRKDVGPTRFFVAGEYGSVNWRPHFHAGLFGLWLSDFKYWRKSESGFKLYRSATLERLWPFGSVEIGELTFQSAAYMARYVMEKRTGELAKDYYSRVCPESGEIYSLVPEFCRMSLRPGIGAAWYQRHGARVRAHDTVISDGGEAKPPRYYDKLFKRLDPDGFEAVSDKRVAEAVVHVADNTPERLAVREEVTKARIRFKVRN